MGSVGIGSRGHRGLRLAFLSGSALAFFGISGLLAAELSVELAGLRVVGPGYGLNGNELQAFREGPGVTLALAIVAPPGRAIVDVDSDGSKVDSIADDVGTDLREEVDWGYFPEITADGSHALIELSVGRRPSPNARQLRATGSIAVKLATATRTERLERVSFAPGTVLEVTGGTLKVELAGKDEEWPEGVRVVLGTTAAFNDAIRELRLLSASGEEMDTQGSGQTIIGSQAQREIYLSTEELPAGIELEIFEGLQSIEVPFSLEAGLGLQR